MKRVILSLVMILGLGVYGANAQSEKLSFGAKAEANMSGFFLSDMDNTKSELGVGASVAGFMKYDICDFFAIQPELMFHYKGSKLKNETTNAKIDYNYWGMEIPVYGVFQTKIGEGRGYVGVGPYFGLGFSSETDDFGNYKDVPGRDKSYMSRVDVGAGAMLGYELKCGLQFNAGYKMGFMNMANLHKDDYKMRNHAISLGIGYRF